MPDRILVVEDESKLAALLRDYLVQEGFEVTVLHRGDEVEPWVAEHEGDLVLLDLMLPGKNGLDVCRALRARGDVAIVMVTARVEEIDRLLGLELGADDYICKPFSPREVVARVKAILRRVKRGGGEVESAPGEAGRSPARHRPEAGRRGPSRDDRRPRSRAHRGGVSALQG